MLAYKIYLLVLANVRGFIFNCLPSSLWHAFKTCLQPFLPGVVPQNMLLIMLIVMIGVCLRIRIMKLRIKHIMFKPEYQI